MIIEHPLLGPRDSQEFTYLGDASLLHRPDASASDAAATFFDYPDLRASPAGTRREVWSHEMGDRSWLVITRDTTSHEILAVELASDIPAAGGQS